MANNYKRRRDIKNNTFLTAGSVTENVFCKCPVAIITVSAQVSSTEGRDCTYVRTVTKL